MATSNKHHTPVLMVFDLDYTLWPFWVDTHVCPPFKKDKKGNVIDHMGKRIDYYPEVPAILEKLYKDGYKLGLASRTSEIDGAQQLLELFDWNKYFTFKEIYPGCKKTHFDRIQKKSNIAFKDMIFFDDEQRNIRDLTSHGVMSILVEHGVNWKVIEHGLTAFKAT